MKMRCSENGALGSERLAKVVKTEMLSYDSRFKPNVLFSISFYSNLDELD